MQRQLKAALGLEEGVLESAKAERSKEEQNLREDIKRAQEDLKDRLTREKAKFEEALETKNLVEDEKKLKLKN